MGMRTLENQKVRTISQNNSGTYAVTLPIATVRHLRWRKGQKVVLERRGKKIIVEDWQPK